MDRKTIYGFLLIAVVLIIFSLLNKPSKETDQPGRLPDSSIGYRDSIISADTARKFAIIEESKDSLYSSENDSVKALAEDSDLRIPAPFNQFTKKIDKVITIESDLLKIKISPKGGRISYAELTQYKTFDGKPLILFEDNDAYFGYKFPYKNTTINIADLYFNTDSESSIVSGDDSVKVSMILKLGDSKYLEHKFTVYGNSYMVDYKIKMYGFDEIIPRHNQRLDFDWTLKSRQLERKTTEQGSKMTRNINTTTVYYKFLDDSPENLSKTKDTKVEDFKGGRIKWVSFKQPFFCQSLILNNFTTEGGQASNISLQDSNYEKSMSAKLIVRFSGNREEQYNMSLYFGPNHYKTLKSYNLNLERQIFLGKSVLRLVNTGLIIPVFNFLSKYISNYGIIILLLTIFIKMLLLPLTFKSYISTAKMRVLKPEIDAIKKKAGKDATKAQTEQMKFYKKAGVSPLGGCLPMILQMPILIALFRFFPSSIELRQQGFLWAKDLSTYDSIWDFPNGFSIPFYGDHISLFTLLMTVSTILYTKANSQMMGGDTQKQMRIIQYLMPIMFLGFFNNYSAGLSYYYFLANIITFGQQYLFKFFINEDKLKQKIEENKKKKAGKAPSKWQKRLEQLQKQQRQRKR